MPDDNNIVNQNMAVPASAPPTGIPSGSASAPPVVADSPWNEPLPAEAPKSQAAGTLNGAQPATQLSKPFALPQNVEGSLPPVVKATDLASSNVSTPAGAQPIAPGSPINPAFSYNFAQNQSAPANPPVVNTIQPPAPAAAVANGPVSVAKPIDSISGGLPPVTIPAPAPAPAPIPQNAGVSALISNPVANPAVPVTPIPPVSPVAPTPIAQPASQAVVQPTQPIPAPIQPLPPLPTSQAQPFVVPSVVPDASATAPSLSAEEPKKRFGLSRLFAGLKRKPKAENQTSEASISTGSDVNAGVKNKKRTVVYIIVSILFILGLLIYATEAGLLSIGLEKTYGAVGLERLWGGLPKDSQTAFAKSLVAMKDHQKFKVSGTISLNVDKTIKNAVTTPLVSSADSITRVAVLPIKAILAVAETTTDPTVTDSTSTDTSTDTSTSTGDSTLTDPSTTSTSSTSDTAVPADSTATASDQSTETVYADTTTTKTVNATITASFGDTGNDIGIKIVKPIGSETIDLKNAQSNLWVKSDQNKFGETAESGKWLLYNLAALNNGSVVSQTLAIDSSKGFSAEGARQSDEKVGTTRCYKYGLGNVELGNSLAGIGILSDSIQNISGTVWIGVKDKLIRRLDLKVTTSPSSPIIQMNLSLNFSDYDAGNNFAAPASTDVVGSVTPTTSPASGE